MNNKLIVANWKSHKNIESSIAWLEEFAKQAHLIDFSNKTIVVCPSFTSLAMMTPVISNLNLPIKLGAQTVSSFEEGPYTGEVASSQLQELVEYVIVGHSERRTVNHESDEEIARKLDIAKKYELKSVFCIQNADTVIPHNADIIAYEPPSAIGTGNPASLEDVEQVVKKISEKIAYSKFLYGGSVSDSNIAQFMKSQSIDGLLVGSSSLDGKEFAALLQRW